MIEAFIRQRLHRKEDIEGFDRAIKWQQSEEEMRATWGMGPEAEAGQAAMMGLGGLPR